MAEPAPAAPEPRRIGALHPQRPEPPLAPVGEAPIVAPRRGWTIGRTARIGVLALVLLAGVTGGAYWLNDRFTHVFVSDSRIASDIVSVSSQVPGRVVSIAVRTGQPVKAGDLLIRMDDRDAAFQAAELQAQMAVAGAERERLVARIDMVERQAASQIAGAKSRRVAAETTLAATGSDLEFARTAYDRARALLAAGVIAQLRLDTDRAAFARAEQAFARARAEVEVASASLLQAEADQREVQVLRRELAGLEPKTDALRAQLDRQKLAVTEHEIRAALDGVIDGTFVKPGEFVGPGQRLLLIHNPDDIWVDANVKETDIRHLKVGRSVQVTVDAYPGEIFEGTIARVGHAATSQFALLPNANPSGTFTKVTQRLPVKISVAQRDGLLRPGMMVEVKIDVDR